MSLKIYRDQIDKIDDNLVDLIERRELLVKMVDKIKCKKGEDIELEDRQDEILERVCNGKSSLKRDKMITIFKLLFKEESF